MATYAWQKSSYSHEGANCLNIATADGSTLLLCESDDPTSVLTPAPAKLGALISAVKGGHLTREGCP
ncbi:DUF397 domain-containing protein [Streptomyces blastmyceticus]|uniref:DUF397 domain-containing protein n=1 Tax=Streptomyces blastmyceticus TaxID=68180 RepID=A0ABP3G457_9ACTN